MSFARNPKTPKRNPKYTEIGKKVEYSCKQSGLKRLIRFDKNDKDIKSELIKMVKIVEGLR